MSETVVDSAAVRAAFPDRLNPILVKELRSALRGRYFRFLFPLTLLVATVVAVLVVVDGVDRNTDVLGRQLFQAMFVCLLLAVNGLVPFSAFLSMGNEWDEHTYDLLVLSKLEPKRIVLGKLVSVGAEAMLYFSAFAPFLVFAFLLRGIDIATIVVLVIGAAILSASSSAVALALSSMGRHRVVRVILMAVLGAILFGANAGAIAFLDSYVRRPTALNTVEAWQVLTITYALIALPGVLAAAAGTSVLAHVEENASTAPRVLVTALLVVMLGVATWVQGTSPSREMTLAVGVMCAIGVALCDLGFVTEGLRLSRRVRLLVPRKKIAALFSIPFLPGAGRGVLLLLFHLALIAIAVGVMEAMGPSASFTRGGSGSPSRRSFVFSCFLFVYLALPSLIATSACASARGRVIVRVLIPVVALLSIFLPMLLGFFVGASSWTDGRHIFNPIWVAFDDEVAAGIVVALFAAVVLVANVPRVSTSVQEVLDASAARARLVPSPAAAEPEATRAA